jgi:hypothetical protein
MFRTRHCVLPPVCVALLAVTALTTAAAGAQSAATEVWPEVDLFWRPTDRYRSMFELSASTEREGSRQEGTLGLYQDYLWLPRGYARLGYRFTFSRRDASYRESRAVAEVTIAGGIAPRTRLLNRTRTELRWVNSRYSYRVRDRIQVQHALQDSGRALAPYGTMEAYYDSRHRALSRIGGRIGTDLRIASRVVTDVYVARQNNSRDQPRYVNALGIVLKVTVP